ncbi:hypothetical protein IPF37_02995 [bacterium]|nr:MAG: hypothetical protein IPF37_02995 [bacterium]
MKKFIINFCLGIFLVGSVWSQKQQQQPIAVLRDPFFIEKKKRAKRVVDYKPQLVGIVGHGKAIGAVIALRADKQKTVFQGDSIGGYRVLFVHKDKVGLQRGKRITTLSMN